jgi:hypothetical protein
MNLNKKEMLEALETADALYNASMDETTSEEDQDTAYAAYHEKVQEIAEALQKLIPIDKITAGRMAHHKRKEIHDLTTRLA